MNQGQGSFSEKIWSLDRRMYPPNYLNDASETDTAPEAFEPPAPEKTPEPERKDAKRAYDGLL